MIRLNKGSKAITTIIVATLATPSFKASANGTISSYQQVNTYK
jgi:hypothetical protein